MPADLEAGRRAHDRNDWSEAYANLRDAQTAEDLERLAVAAQLVGREDEAIQTYQRAHKAFLEEGKVERALRCAAHLVINLMNRGDIAQAQGWLARARRI